MNARQKAKRYKRAYEALLAKSKPLIELKKEEYEVDTLNFVTSLSEEYIVEGDKDCIKRVVADTFADMLVKSANKYISYSLERSPYTQKHILKWQIKVLKRLPKV